MFMQQSYIQAKLCSGKKLSLLVAMLDELWLLQCLSAWTMQQYNMETIFY